MSRSLTNCFFRLLLLAAILLTPGYGIGSESRIAPSIAIRSEYIDNIFLSQQDIINDFIHTISPGLTFSEKTEQTFLSLKGILEKSWYQDNSQFDGNDKSAEGRFQYQPSQRINLSSQASYSRNSRPDRDLDVSGLVLGATERDRYKGNLTSIYSVSETTGILSSVSFNKDDYLQDTQSTYDYDAVNLMLGIQRNLSQLLPMTTLVLNSRYGRYDYENSDVDYYTITAGVDHALSELLSLRIEIGTRYTVSTFQIQRLVLLPDLTPAALPETLQNKAWGGIGQVDMSYSGERIDWKISFSHDIQPASGRAGSSNRTALIITVNRRFTDKLSTRISGSYYRNRADKNEYSDTIINEETYRGRVRIQYRFTRMATLAIGLSTARALDMADHTKADRNLIFIGYNHQFELF